MRILLLGIFVATLALTPVFLLSAFVMPEVNSLKNTYSSADQIADRVANQDR